MWRGLEVIEGTQGVGSVDGLGTKPNIVGKKKLRQRNLRRGWHENRWEPLRCRMMSCEENREVACSEKREAQQGTKCWRCGEVGHCLWECPNKVVCPARGEVQQRKLICLKYKGENHVA